MLQDHHDTSLSVLRHQLAPDEMEAKGADAPMAIWGPALQLSDTGDFFSKRPLEMPLIARRTSIF